MGTQVGQSPRSDASLLRELLESDSPGDGDGGAMVVVKRQDKESIELASPGNGFRKATAVGHTLTFGRCVGVILFNPSAFSHQSLSVRVYQAANLRHRYKRKATRISA